MRRGASITVLIALVALASLVPDVAAHAEVVSADPANGARLTAAPAFVHVTLSQAVEQSSTSMQVTDQDGNRVDLDDLTFSGATGRPELMVSLKSGLPPGAYSVTVHTISGDSHPVTHRVGFAVGTFEPPGATGPNKTPAESALGRFLLFSGMAIALGVTAMGAWVRPITLGPTGTRNALTLAAVLHLAGAALLLHYTSSASGLGLHELSGSAVGRNQFLRLVLAAAAVALVGVAGQRRSGRAFAVAMMGASALVTALGSHSSRHGSAEVALDLVHLVATTTWVGSLLVLVYLVVRAPNLPVGSLRVAGRRFGTIGLACVAILYGTGFILAATILGSDAILHPSTLFASTYGAVLFAKFVLATLMVGLAGVNRYVLLEPPTGKGVAGLLQRTVGAMTGGRVRPLAEGEPTRRCHRTMATEAGLGLVILVLAGVLTSISPGVVAPGDDAARFHAVGDHHSVTLVLFPGPTLGATSHGQVSIVDDLGRIVSENTCGRLAPASCVRLHLVAASGSQTHDLVPDGNGGWMVHGLLWGARGIMNATIEISTADVFADAAHFELTVR